VKKNKQLWILTGLVVLMTAFIFSNSFKGSAHSTADSDSIIAWIQPVVRWIFGEDHNINLHFWVRKTAHLCEFALLGGLTTGLLITWKAGKNRYFRGYEFFYVLAVAVVDEFIQSFTGRTSSVKDVLLDFTGALLGFCAVWLIHKRINKKRKANNDGN